MIKLHMGEMIPQSHEKQAILGKMAEGQKAIKIDSIARETLNVMYINPIDDVAKRKIDTESSKIIGVIGNGAKSVEDLNNILVDENKTNTQKEIAKEGKEMLAKGVFIAMQYGMNNEMVDLLGKGSAVEIDKKLPEPLKGLGEEILKNIITNEQVLGILKELDKKTVEDGWDLMPPTKEEKKLVLEASARELAKLGKMIPVGNKDRDQLIMAISYLQTELLDLNEGTKVVVQQNNETKKEEDGEKVERQDREDGFPDSWESLVIDESEQPKEDDTEEVRAEKIARIGDKVVKRGGRTWKTLKRFSEKIDRQERETVSFAEVEDIRHTLKEMEDSGRDVSDLSLNSRKFSHLINITNCINDTIRAIDEGDEERINKAIVIRAKDGHILSRDEMAEMATEIKMRCFLNDYFLATSDARDIESMVKAVVAFHKGDTDKTLDKEYLSFFLKKKENGESANGLCVDVAWDMRQRAYFDYGGKDERDGQVVDGGGLLGEIAQNSELMRQYAKKRGKGESEREAKEEFLKVTVLMGKSEQYGISRDYFTNFRNDLDMDRREVVKEYMIDKIMERVLVSNPDYTRNEAERAYELARKLSVATYIDSAANVAFADGDDYAELVMFKFLRYQDGVETKKKIETYADGSGRTRERTVRVPAKNKPVGSVETIKFIDTLTPTWLATYAKNTSSRGMWKPLRAEDIDFGKINPKAESTYHFGSIIMKKVQQAKLLLMSSPKYEDTAHPDKVQQAYERLTKTISEARSSGWDVINPKYFNIGQGLTSDKIREQQFLRFIYVIGVVERATRSPLFGWSRNAFDSFEKLLMRGRIFVDEVHGDMSGTFIDQKQMDYILKVYNPRRRFADMDADRRAEPR